METPVTILPMAEEGPAKTPGSCWRPLRTWPIWLLLAGMVVLHFLPSLWQDGPPMLWVSVAFGPALCGLLLLLWWLVFSRACWKEKLVGLAGIIVAFMATMANSDPTMRGPSVPVMTIPMGMAGFGIGSILCARMTSIARVILPLFLAILGFGFTTLVRTDGMWGNFAMNLDWRWNKSRETTYLEHSKTNKGNETSITRAKESLLKPEWPQFRGIHQDSHQKGTILNTDWKTNPPKLLWKVPVGPGWSSFAVAGKYLFTQDQRGPMEAVGCFETDTGKEIWSREKESRFNDPLGGPGPRATPTLADGALYATFATGTLMKMDAATGKVLWEKEINEIANRKTMIFGYSPSPLVVKGLVIVHAGGEGDKGILAFDAADGKLKWSAPSGEHSYSSAHQATILGEEVIIMLSNTGMNIIDPATGAQRLNYIWKYAGYRALQPAMIGEDALLIPTGMGAGTRRVRLEKAADAKAGGELKATEEWTSRNLKPDFNDLVVSWDYAYGFDNNIFTCINLENGNRAWKGPDFGKGQVLFLEDSNMLLVVGEQGELALVHCDPKTYREAGRIQALEGKTWNHPVVVGDRLYIRNSQEMACYRLALDTIQKPAGDKPAESIK